MLPPTCAFLRDNGARCTQPALNGDRYCRIHHKVANRAVTERENHRIRESITSLDLQYLIACLQDTLTDVLHHRISPDRQHLIYLAAQQRLTALLIEAQVRDAADPRSPYYDEERFGPASRPSAPPFHPPGRPSPAPAKWPATPALSPAPTVPSPWRNSSAPTPSASALSPLTRWAS